MLYLYRGLTGISKFIFKPASKISGKGKTSEFLKGVSAKIPDGTVEGRGRRYWFHCASLGEFEQARPMIEKIKRTETVSIIMVTFFSPSGYRQRHKFPLADKVMYLPIDTPSNARRLLDYLRPEIVFFVKYEFWYYYLKELHKRNIPVYLLSAVFRKDQFIFSWFGKWLYHVLPLFRKIFVQDKNSFRLLKDKGLKNIKLSGDTRYDRVKEHALDVKTNDKIEQFKSGSDLLVLGSSWQEEEDLLMKYLDLSPEIMDLKIMITPHDISDSHIREIEEKFKNYGTTRYTSGDFNSEKRILILDTIGHLASSYLYADLAFIGGGFGRGLHNILEALAFGVPVLFGPVFSKHPEAELALESGVAYTVSSAEVLKERIMYFRTGEERNNYRSKCIDFINWNSGATEMVWEEIKYERSNAGKS